MIRPRRPPSAPPRDLRNTNDCARVSWQGRFWRNAAGLTLLLVGMGGACSPQNHRLTPAELAALKPSDPHLAELYEHSCKACHSQTGSGAPLVHDHAAWDPRWAKGEDVLLNHAILGFQAMPAGGQCAACTPKDFQAIIRFMADRE